MSAISKYALCVETDPAALVQSVTNLAGMGFLPVGGCAMVREPANPSKGLAVGVTKYSQAMVLPVQREANPLIVNGR